MQTQAFAQDSAGRQQREATGETVHTNTIASSMHNKGKHERKGSLSKKAQIVAKLSDNKSNSGRTLVSIPKPRKMLANTLKSSRKIVPKTTSQSDTDLSQHSITSPSLETGNVTHMRRGKTKLVAEKEVLKDIFMVSGNNDNGESTAVRGEKDQTVPNSTPSCQRLQKNASHNSNQSKKTVIFATKEHTPRPKARSLLKKVHRMVKRKSTSRTAVSQNQNCNHNDKSNSDNKNLAKLSQQKRKAQKITSLPKNKNSIHKLHPQINTSITQTTNKKGSVVGYVPGKLKIKVRKRNRKVKIPDITDNQEETAKYECKANTLNHSQNHVTEKGKVMNNCIKSKAIKSCPSKNSSQNAKTILKDTKVSQTEIIEADISCADQSQKDKTGENKKEAGKKHGNKKFKICLHCRHKTHKTKPVGSTDVQHSGIKA